MRAPPDSITTLKTHFVSDSQMIGACHGPHSGWIETQKLREAEGGLTLLKQLKPRGNTVSWSVNRNVEGASTESNLNYLSALAEQPHLLVK